VPADRREGSGGPDRSGRRGRGCSWPRRIAGPARRTPPGTGPRDGAPVKLRRPAGVLTPGCQSRPTGRPRRQALAGCRPSATKPPNTDPRRNPVLDAPAGTVTTRPPKRSRRARRSECACPRPGRLRADRRSDRLAATERSRSGRRSGPLASAERIRADRRSDRLVPAVASACPRRNGCGCDRRNGRELGCRWP
jgi:hypothetical protein